MEDTSLPVIPDHQLLQRIGHGSYGDVWLARSTMGMHRAVKIVYRKSFEHARPYERELSGIQKFEPISRSHEGLIDVLHVGRDEARGYFFYIMELGDDQASGQQIDPQNYLPRTLSHEISSRGRLDFQECLQLGLALSQALAQLHKHGLVHRDVKPSNIIFVNGVPKLADIGLVAEVSEARSYVGTEGFIPPEGPGAPSADVYSLGKVLYEVSTGKDRQQFPELPTLLDSFPDHDRFMELNEVILHACKQDTGNRYQSAWDMHADLLLLANGRSVKRLKMLERRLARFKRIVGIAAVVLTIVGGVAYLVYREWQTAAEIRQRQVGASIAYGNSALDAGDQLGALPHFAEAFSADARNLKEQTNHRLRIGATLAHCPKITHMWFAGKAVNHGCFSPDGKRILLARDDAQSEIYDLENDRVTSRPFGPQATRRMAAFSHDGRLIVTASENGPATTWDAVTLKEKRNLPHPKGVSSANFSPDGRMIVTSSYDGRARVWEAETGELMWPLDFHTQAVRYATFSHNGKLIVTASEDSFARIWDAESGRAIGHPLPHSSWVYYAAFSPDDRRLVTASFDRKARVWDVATQKRLMPEMEHGDGVSSAEFSPDGTTIVTACLDGSVKLWQAENLLPLESNPVMRHGERVLHACFSPDGRCVATSCADGSVRIWDLAGCAVPPIGSRAYLSRDGNWLLPLTNNSVQVWNTTSGQAVSPPIEATFPIERAEFAGDGRTFLLVSRMATNPIVTRLLQVWDIATGKPVAPGILISNALGGSSLSADGKLLATYHGKITQLWDVMAQSPILPELVHDNQVGAATFAPDGRRLATLSGNRTHVWDTTTRTPALEPITHPDQVAFVEFSPDGLLLVTGWKNDQYTKCSAQVWSVATGQPLGPELKHNDGVLRGFFSPDNLSVATCGEDFSASIWAIPSGHQVAPTIRHRDKIRTATFSPDGKWLITASTDKSARVWNAETGDPLTPRMRHLVGLTSGQMLANGRQVAARFQTNLWIWTLPVDKRPVEDLKLLARLMSGNTAKPSEQPSPATAESLHAIWQQLRTKYPSSFSTTAQEIVAWHEFEAQKCEANQQWSAAVFHLKYVAELRPDFPNVAARLTRANEMQKRENY